MFRHRRRVTARVLPGLVIVGLGVLLVLNNLDVYPLGGLERYWPLLLVAFGIHRVFDPARRGRGLGAVVLVAGIWLQLSKLDLLSFHLADLKLYWPLILVAIGLYQLTGTRRHGWGASLGLGAVLAGILFQLANFGIVRPDVWRLWPLLLIVLGIGMVYKVMRGRVWLR